MHVSHKWLYHLDACAGSVLAPQDYVTNVQKRLNNRAYTGCGAACVDLGPQLEHSETCSTPEATQELHACVNPILGGLRLAAAQLALGCGVHVESCHRRRQVLVEALLVNSYLREVQHLQCEFSRHAGQRARVASN